MLRHDLRPVGVRAQLQAAGPSLREMGYHVVEPGGAFYLFPRSLEPDDLAFSERAKQFDLLLVPGSGFGAPGHVRIAYCVQTDMIQRPCPSSRPWPTPTDKSIGPIRDGWGRCFLPLSKQYKFSKDAYGADHINTYHR